MQRGYIVVSVSPRIGRSEVRGGPSTRLATLAHRNGISPAPPYNIGRDILDPAVRRRSVGDISLAGSGRPKTSLAPSVRAGNGRGADGKTGVI